MEEALKFAVLCVVGWLSWWAGYQFGKRDLWAFLAKNYIILKKGSYFFGGKK